MWLSVVVFSSGTERRTKRRKKKKLKKEEIMIMKKKRKRKGRGVEGRGGRKEGVKEGYHEKPDSHVP